MVATVSGSDKRSLSVCEHAKAECSGVCRQQKGACRPVRVNGARDITRLMAQTAIQVKPLPNSKRP